jgi:DNA polymerase-3 subunit gamma/tau
MALYRKWRPQTFDEVVEQEGVVNILRNAVVQNRIAHAYLFSGTRGTGKTTLAKIFARAVNCLHPRGGNPCNECEICRGIMNRQILDVSEIDAASNNGVDNIRTVIDDSAYSSSVARYRVYIIDEVHMLSLAAFNALLKTLEEPPENVIFILATTEPQKLPVTVLSRCQRYEFKRISRDGIVARLKYICGESGIDATDEALGFLAEKADGALRDAISLLDQTSAASEGRITLATARAATGSLDREFLWDFVSGILNSDSEKLLRLSNRIFRDGRDPSTFLKELIEVLRNMMIVTSVKDPSDLIFEDAEGIKQLKNLAKGLRVREIGMLIRELSGLDNNLRWAVSRQIVFEAGILAASDRRWREETASVETRLSELEDRIADIAAGGIVYREKSVNDGLSGSFAEAVVNETAEVDRGESSGNIGKYEEIPENKAEKPSTAPVAAEAANEPAEPKAETAAEAAVGTGPDAVSGGCRKLTAAEWQDICSEMEHRGQMSMLTWYSDSTAQYELSGDRLLIAFDDDMTVSILKKSTAANLKVVNEAIAARFGRKMEQVVAETGEAQKMIDAAKGTSAAFAAPVASVATVATAEPAASAATADSRPAKNEEPALPDERPAETGSERPDDKFDSAVDYFKNLAGKMNFSVDFKKD